MGKRFSGLIIIQSIQCAHHSVFPLQCLHFRCDQCTVRLFVQVVALVGRGVHHQQAEQFRARCGGQFTAEGGQSGHGQDSIGRSSGRFQGKTIQLEMN